MLSRRGLLLAGAAARAQGADSKQLILANAEYPPYVMPGGEDVGEGIDIDLAREALRPAGYEITLRLVPWKRALAMLEQGEADLTTTVSLSADRDRYLRHSIGYRRQVRYHFYALRERRMRLDSLAALSGLRIGMAAGFRYPAPIEIAAGAGVDRVRDLPTLVGLLAAGRVDLICANALPLAWTLRQTGLGDRVERMRYEHVSRSSTYMGISLPRHGENSRLLAVLDGGLARLLKSGRAAAIERHYIGKV